MVFAGGKGGGRVSWSESAESWADREGDKGGASSRRPGEVVDNGVDSVDDFDKPVGGLAVVEVSDGEGLAARDGLLDPVVDLGGEDG